MSDVVGLDIKFIPPANPHIVLNNDEDRTSFDPFVEIIMAHITVVIRQVRSAR